MRTNTSVKADPVFNNEGVRATSRPPIDQLRRSVLACLLYEKGFYEEGEEVAARIKRLVKECKPADVAQLAIDAREKHHLRHVPLLLVRELARYPSRFSVGDTLARVIQRADEIGEFLALYWADVKKDDPRKRGPLAAQVKKGLARAFGKFDEYQLAKYDRANSAVRLRDAAMLVHVKPRDEKLMAKLVNKTFFPEKTKAGAAVKALFGEADKPGLATPDTWEVALSAGSSKKETFERLLAERKLGYMALLRNLRNMQQAEVTQGPVFEALLAGAAKSKALPFRYIAAARAVPAWEPMIDAAMQLALGGLDRLAGETIVLVDTSPSMAGPLSGKSDLNRMDAAFGVAILLRGICETARVFAFSNDVAEVPARNGMALADAIRRAVPSNGTMLGHAIKHVAKAAPKATRLIVFTDEESQDSVPDPHCRGYMVNVAVSQYGVASDKWERINGFSESVVDYIRALESQATVTSVAA